jgi:replication factor A1
MLQMELVDTSGTTWATMFDEKATQLLGMTAEKLAHLQRDDKPQYDAVFSKLLFQPFHFRVRFKMEMYNDQQTTKCSVMDIRPAPFDKLVAELSEQVAKLEMQ